MEVECADCGEKYDPGNEQPGHHAEDCPVRAGLLKRDRGPGDE